MACITPVKPFTSSFTDSQDETDRHRNRYTPTCRHTQTKRRHHAQRKPAKANENGENNCEDSVRYEKILSCKSLVSQSQQTKLEDYFSAE